MRAVSSAYSANSTWREGAGMSFTYRLNSTGETSPPCVTPALMLRRVDVAELKDDWNVRPWRYDDKVFTRYDGKFRIVSL
jgi:hypothetical protein